MKLSLSLLALAGFAVTTVTADDGTKCSNKAPSVVNAIGKFCQKTNMVVPSKYATGGMMGYAGKQTRISITGNCGPAQWVPQEYCFKQFYHMCATGTSSGTSAKRYGRNGCQTWLIGNG
ncbi:hypothetical protein LTR08_004143 [Meristemomyces frigidus]|nr:hypothetical protein LTR08_004143 [Meristemomyces frigidus]